MSDTGLQETRFDSTTTCT